MSNKRQLEERIRQIYKKIISENNHKMKLYVQPIKLIFQGPTGKRYTKITNFSFEDGFKTNTRRLQGLGFRGIDGAIKHYNSSKNQTYTKNDFDIKIFPEQTENDMKY